MKLDACDKDPLRVLRDVLKEAPPGPLVDRIEWALGASSAAPTGRSSDGSHAETRPPSAVPVASSLATVQALRADLARVTAERDEVREEAMARLGDAEQMEAQRDEARSALAEAQAEVERLHKHLNHSNEQWRVEFDRGHAAGKREGIEAAIEAVGKMQEWQSSYRFMLEYAQDAIRSLLSEPQPEKAPGAPDGATKCGFCGGGRIVNAVEGGTAPCPKCAPEASPVGEGRVGILAAAKILEGFASGRWVANGHKARRLLRRAAADLRAIASTPPQAPETPVTPNSQAGTPSAKCDNLSQVGASEAGGDSLARRLARHLQRWGYSLRPDTLDLCAEAVAALSEAADALEGARERIAQAARVAELEEALRSCRNLTHRQHDTPQDVRQIGLMVAATVDKALAATETAVK